MTNDIYLFNSLKRNKEVFEPLNQGVVKMYHCGPTVYNYPHLGNQRAFVVADTLKRMLRLAGYKVDQVMNITDVGHLTDDADQGEDKVEKQARTEKKSAREITDYYTECFFADLKDLNFLTEGVSFPRATDHITEQIELIKRLQANGYAYKISDGIYFDTSKLTQYDVFKTVGEQLAAGARVEINSEKRQAADFALWKFTQPHEKRLQEWDSPWGMGYPGWHLECSAMSMKYLGASFDIHTGGVEHKFPHHPNEIAQSEAATAQPYARYWLHHEHINIQGEKMAKSGQNFVTLQDLKDRGYSPIAFRYWLLTAHYRSSASFSWEVLNASSIALAKLRSKVERWFQANTDLKPGKIDPEYHHKLLAGIYDDLDTPRVIADLWSLIKNNDLATKNKLATIELYDQVLGLDLLSTKRSIGEVPASVKKIAAEREQARQADQWSEADRLREEIRSYGYEIEDTPQGPRFISKDHDKRSL